MSTPEWKHGNADKVWHDIPCCHRFDVSVTKKAAVRLSELRGGWLIVPSSCLTYTAEEHHQVVLAEQVHADVMVANKKIQFNLLLAAIMKAICNTYGVPEYSTNIIVLFI